MEPWANRPKEEANLLNPAFCCAILTSAVVGYSTQEPQGMPFPLAFIIMPIILHKQTREAIPPNARTSLPTWMQQHTSLQIQFPERVVALIPFVKEAILFGTTHEWLIFREDAKIGTAFSRRDIRLDAAKIVGEARECIMRAHFVGKWFASAGTAQMVMAFWGVKP